MQRGPPQWAIHGPVRLTRHPWRVAHCAIPALGRPQVAICVGHAFYADLENQKQGESERRLAEEICKADLLFAFAFPAAISQTPQNARREGERRCRGVGRSAWMPSERRWAMDGPSARARPTVPERRNRREAGAVRQRNGFGYFCRNKSDPAVRTEPDSAAPGCSAGTQFKAHHSDSSKLQTYKERLQPRGAGTVDAYSPPVKLLRG